MLNATNHYTKGREAYIKGDYFIALKEFHLSARQHNSNAYMELGIMYEKGIGTKANGMSALYWYYKAKKAGNSYAKEKLTPSFVKELESASTEEEKIEDSDY